MSFVRFIRRVTKAAVVTQEAPDSDSVIAIDEDELVVRNLRLSDPDVVGYFGDQRPELRQERFVTAVRTGVAALKSTDVSARIDYVEKRFQEMGRRFDDSLNDALGKMDEYLGDEGTMHDIAKEYLGKDGTLIRDVLNPEAEASPLYSLRRAMTDEVDRLRTDLGLKKERAEVASATTLKGRVFEGYCEEILEGYAMGYGDIVENTADVLGSLRGKKGDLVVTLNGSDDRIAFELKDVDRISGPEIRKTLDESIKNRDASYGVLVAKYVESLPGDVWFQEMDSNKLVVALGSREEDKEADAVPHKGPLIVAYHWAKTRVVTDKLAKRGIDTGAIAEKTVLIRSKIKEMARIKSECTNIRKSADNIENRVKELESGIKDALDGVTSSLDSVDTQQTVA